MLTIAREQEVFYIANNTSKTITPIVGGGKPSYTYQWHEISGTTQILLPEYNNQSSITLVNTFNYTTFFTILRLSTANFIS
jgi:hypothetical protein